MNTWVSCRRQVVEDGAHPCCCSGFRHPCSTPFLNDRAEDLNQLS